MRSRSDKTAGLIENGSLMAEGEIRSAIEKISHLIVKDHPSGKDLLLIGIRTGGVTLAERIQAFLQECYGHSIPMGIMDITLYRDDALVGLPRPEVGPTQMPCSLEGRTVILVDDVLFTGRTIRAALAELIDFGRPQGVKLAVLVDRGHRELPIQPNYTGLQVRTARDESVLVFLKTDKTGEDRVSLFGQSPKSCLNYEKQSI